MNAEQQFLADAALLSFKLNGQFLDLAEELARPVGLTAAWWQVLGAVLPGPLTVAGIAREMGMARQSVQRIADLLVERGMAAYEDNPAHRRAKLLSMTGAGHEAVARINPAHRVTAHKLVATLGAADMARAVEALRQLLDALDQLGQERSKSPSQRAESARSAPAALSRGRF